MGGDDHVRGQLWKRMGAVFGTFHFHVATKSGFEAGYPSLPGGCRQGYMGDGGGGRNRPMRCRTVHIKTAEYRITFGVMASCYRVCVYLFNNSLDSHPN